MLWVNSLIYSYFRSLPNVCMSDWTFQIRKYKARLGFWGGWWASSPYLVEFCSNEKIIYETKVVVGLFKGIQKRRVVPLWSSVFFLTKFFLVVSTWINHISVAFFLVWFNVYLRGFRSQSCLKIDRYNRGLGDILTIKIRNFITLLVLRVYFVY